MRAKVIVLVLGSLAGLVLALSSCGGRESVAGTWGIAQGLDRKLDRRLEKRRVTAPALQRQLERLRSRREVLGSELEQVRLLERSSRERSSQTVRCRPGVLERVIVGAIHVGTLGFSAAAGLDARDIAGDCLTPDAVEGALEARRYADRARALVARRARAQRLVRAAARRVRGEAALAVRTRAKARAARLITADDVTCEVRDARVRVRIKLRNGFGSGIEVLVTPAYFSRGADGRRVAAASAKDTLLSLDRDEERELDIDAGPSPVGGIEAILTCAPRLNDVRLVEADIARASGA